MRKAFKYCIYLTKGQRRMLEQQLEISRWVYNETLAERKSAYEERGESLRLYDLVTTHAAPTSSTSAPFASKWVRTKTQRIAAHGKVV